MSLALFVQALAWSSFAFVMISTVTPTNGKECLSRVGFEGVFLSGLMGVLFIAAYPDDRRIMALLCVFAVIASECLRVVFRSRPPSVEGTVVRIFGAAVGLIIGGVLMQI